MQVPEALQQVVAKEREVEKLPEVVHPTAGEGRGIEATSGQEESGLGQCEDSEKEEEGASTWWTARARGFLGPGGRYRLSRRQGHGSDVTGGRSWHRKCL